jgi:parvulin-like peptidyl-prolyl isomerase
MLACRYSLAKSAGDGGDLGYIAPTDLAPEVAAVLQASKDNGLFGPIQTANGFELISLEDRKINIPKPADLDKERSQLFTQWQVRKAESDFVTVLNDSWKQAIPTDPLPRDVSPLMIEENFGLPTPQPTITATP